MKCFKPFRVQYYLSQDSHSLGIFGQVLWSSVHHPELRACIFPLPTHALHKHDGEPLAMCPLKRQDTGKYYCVQAQSIYYLVRKTITKNLYYIIHIGVKYYGRLTLPRIWKLPLSSPHFPLQSDSRTKSG